MADMIARLKLESGEYDSKIKRATQGLLQMEEECRKVGGTLAVLEKDQLDFVKGLGQMETVSRSARGKIGELTSAFTDLSVQYKHLTDEEKKGDYGKALSASLDQLKTRINDAKKELSDVDKELGDASKSGDNFGGVVESLAGKFGLSTSALGVWGAALAAGTVAVNVAKDAFFNNEEQLDEWGRVVESSQSVYEGFLNALNTGDINGFINNINAIVRAASSAYDALDALNTFNAFNQVRVEKTRTAMTESIVDYREGNAKKDDVKAAGDAYKKELESRKKMEREAYIEAIGKVAAERGISKEDLTKALSGTYGEYTKLKNTPLTGTATKYSPGIMPGSSGTYTTYKVAANEQERLGQALRQLNDTELQSLQALGAQAERTSNEIAQVDKQLIRVLNGKSGGGGGGNTSGGGGRTSKVTKTEPWRMLTLPDSYFDVDLTSRSKKDVEKGMAWATKAYNNAGDEWSRMEYKGMIDRYKGALGDMALEGDIRNGALKGAFSYDFGKSLEDFGESKDKEEPREERKLTEQISKLTSGISSIASGMKSMGIDLPDEINQVIGVIQGLTSIVEGVNTVISVFSTTAMTANTAALVANTAALTANSTVNAIPFFARGGIVPHAAEGYYVPGTHYSGDVTPIYANAGELILSKSQQNAIASELSDGNLLNNMHLSATIHGEDIILAVNNTSMRKGRGEFVTTKNR